MVLVFLANPGDDSYNTSIVLHYPEGISLSKFNAIKQIYTGGAGEGGGFLKLSTQVFECCAASSLAADAKETIELYHLSQTRSSCGDRDSSATNRTTCRINLPVYRSGTTTQFLGTFRVTKWDNEWSDWMEMMITANR
ncbi:uncharacterized protein LOC109082663 [Cyprinus carpio]|uniref:Uncharacterized protein LOC109082663 n=1 Tax=Cyprinus carpio TaxID=7962 RepID=A0A9Q9ZT90_CYPCA|nr:uncharacterized protein LOC109082663 [Cyprinus carpio]